jgi:hypothetical protein
MAVTDYAPLTRVIDTQLPAVATVGNDATTVIGIAREAGVVSGVSYVTATAITGANTNSRTIAVVNKGAAGSGSTSVASTAYVTGVNTTALAENALTLSGTAANLVVAVGDVLVATSTHVGTGIADPGGLVRVSITRY